jgi:hypothetical protein
MAAIDSDTTRAEARLHRFKKHLEAAGIPRPIRWYLSGAIKAARFRARFQS